MNAAGLMAMWDRIIDAPDAVGRLRRFIVDLATYGHLSTDGRAGIEGGRSGLPRHWRYESLVNALAEDTRNGYTRRPDGAVDGIPLLRISAGTMRPDGIVAEDEYKLIGGVSDTDQETFSLRRGDVLACRFNGNKSNVGKFSRYIGANSVRPIYPDKLIRIRTRPDVILPEFLCLVGSSSLVREDVEDVCTTTVGNWGVSASNLKDIRIPIPPLVEQHRIVAKFDELMALCNRLEAARAERESRRDRLVTATLTRLATPAPDADAGTIQAHTSFTLANIPHLATRPEHTRQIRRTVQNLAIRGSLIPQDDRDEVSHDALRRIGCQSRDGQVRRLLEAEAPYPIPENWTWATLGSLTLHADAGWSPKSEDHPRQLPTWGILKVSAVSWDTFKEHENKQMLTGTAPRPQAAIHKGDFLISRANTAELVARAVLVEQQVENLMMSDKIVRLHLTDECDPRFILLVNNYGTFARAHYARHASGVSASMKNVSRKVIMDLPIPFPPLAEQHRIVAKVAELMALCDRLEASLAAGAEARRALHEATLRDALAPALDQAA